MKRVLAGLNTFGSDDVRRACGALAMAWLKAAADEDNQDNDHSPLAPEI
jgi:hypothetical protein